MKKKVRYKILFIFLIGISQLFIFNNFLSNIQLVSWIISLIIFIIFLYDYYLFQIKEKLIIKKTFYLLFICWLVLSLINVFKIFLGILDINSIMVMVINIFFFIILLLFTILEIVSPLKKHDN